MNFPLQGSLYNENENETQYNSNIERKKQQKNKTLKRNNASNERLINNGRLSANNGLPVNAHSERELSNNVKNMIGSIHNTLNEGEGEEDNDLANFDPPPHGELARNSNIVNKGIAIANMGELGPGNSNYHVTSINQGEEMLGPVNVDNSIDTVEGFNSLPPVGQNHGYIGSTNNLGVNTYTGPSNYVGPFKEKVPYYTQMSQVGNKDQLLEKLNYMIHLLEEQQDMKTQSVTEELILYSFLGVFIIFIVDGFARSGKYTR
jgi:hypothetical protein